MADHSPSRAQGGSPPLTNATDSHVYSDVLGNIPDLRPLSTPLSTQSLRGTGRDEACGNQDTYRDDQWGASRGLDLPPSNYNGDRAQHMTQGQPPPSSDQTTNSRRYTDGPPSVPALIGDVYGNTNISPLLDGATFEQYYSGDPSNLPMSGPATQIPANIGVRHVIINRLNGNLSAGDIAANAWMRQIYEAPSQQATTASSSQVSVNTLTDSLNPNRPRHAMLVPRHMNHTQSAPGTIPFSGKGYTLGQNPANRDA
ncbi:hypothetical protein BKA70DRAFT_1326390 [Coprinopsis sp. MPI-PUGE-AT-0042]|nr:hypothetical protein BKA70DRAFT_1326390 [Coprinopsis sp. MPI-PUGE-AT-0042]